MQYADSREVEQNIIEKFPQKPAPVEFMKEFEDMDTDDVLSKKHSPKTRKKTIWSQNQKASILPVLAFLFRKIFKYVNVVILWFCGMRYNLSTTNLLYYIT